MRFQRPRLTYANVVATLALVLAIGGTSYAAVTINGKNLKNRSVAGKKLKKNTVTGTEVREAKLGKVPLANLSDLATKATSATDADHAATADTAAGATQAANASKLGSATPESYRVSCPGGTIRVLDECFEPNQRAAKTFPLALKECGAAGRRMPQWGELEAARQNGFTVGVPPNNYELSSSANGATQVIGIDPMGNEIGIANNDPRPFRCVVIPTNAG
jgi:hypothetical protein